MRRLYANFFIALDQFLYGFGPLAYSPRVSHASVKHDSLPFLIIETKILRSLRGGHRCFDAEHSYFPGFGNGFPFLYELVLFQEPGCNKLTSLGRNPVPRNDSGSEREDVDVSLLQECCLASRECLCEFRRSFLDCVQPRFIKLNRRYSGASSLQTLECELRA